MDEKTLEEIAWRAGSGSHFESAFLGGSLYAKQVVEQDVPTLIAEVRRLNKDLEAAEVNFTAIKGELSKCGYYFVWEGEEPVVVCEACGAPLGEDHADDCSFVDAVLNT
jgi:hypothetical protein